MKAEWEHAEGKLRIADRKKRELSEEVNELRFKLGSAKKRLDGAVRGDDGYKILSNDMNTERLVLGLIMNHPELMQERGPGQPYINRMFYYNSYAMIHKAIMDLGTKIDFGRIQQRLTQKGELEAIGGTPALDQIFEEGARADPKLYEDHVSVLEEHYLRRVLTKFCSNRMEECFDSGFDIPSMSEHIRKISLNILELLPFRFRKREDPKSIVGEVMSELEATIKRGGKPEISTGYRGLDRITHGVMAGRLGVCGATTKAGKTTISMNIADAVMSQGYHVMYFTFEQSRREIYKRLIAKTADANSAFFEYFEEFPEVEIGRIREAAENVAEFPLRCESGVPDVAEIRNKVLQYKTANPRLALVIVDGLQSFAGYKPYEGLKTDIYSEVLKNLKQNVAGEAGVMVLIHSQLKQTVLRRKTKRPYRVDDFSDCKGIPEFADSAFFLYRPEEFWPEEEKYRGWMEVIPCVLRHDEKRNRNFKLGADMATAHIWSLKREDYEKIDAGFAAAKKG